MSYFVAALPRSKTAWLAVFLSQSGKYCFHDGMNGCNTLEEYKDKIGDDGDSSTGLQLFDINNLFPDSPIVVIEKSKEELEHCIEWCGSTFGTTRITMLEQYDQLMSVKGLRVKQSDIFHRLKEIFEYLTGCEWMNHYRYLTSFNIQVDPYSIDYQAAERLMRESV